jgi:integrase
MANMLLSPLVDEWIASLESNAFKPTTVRTYTAHARRFLNFVGNIQVKSVTAKRVDDYFNTLRARGQKGSSMNLAKVVLVQLFEFARQRRYLGNFDPSPVAHRGNFPPSLRQRRRLGADEFPALLDAAPNPRDRITIALGLYLLLRQSEIMGLKVGDIDLRHGEVGVRIGKSDLFDYMPLSAELERELRRWLTFYAERAGELQDEWHLVPAKTAYKITEDSRHGGRMRVDVNAYAFRPERPFGEPHNAVIAAMAVLGYAERQDNGESHRDGIHTLRRSAARAIYDRLVDDGYDGALRTVQSWLHHKSSKTTELYLGVGFDTKRRNDMFKGKEMFPVKTGANVIRMEDRHRGQ